MKITCTLNKEQQLAFAQYIGFSLNKGKISLPNMWKKIKEGLDNSDDIIQYAMITPKLLGKAYFHSDLFENNLELSGLSLEVISKYNKLFKEYDNVISTLEKAGVLEVKVTDGEISEDQVVKDLEQQVLAEEFDEYKKNLSNDNKVENHLENKSNEYQETYRPLLKEWLENDLIEIEC